MPKKRYTFAQEQCLRLTGKLMQNTNMIEPSSRIGVAVSGGVDSWVLLKVLALRQKIVPFPFEIMALHINPGFDRNNHSPLADWLENNGITGHIEISEHGLKAHSDENRRKSACFYCAMLRRSQLFKLCKQYKLTHLAFGHNADDLAATFFMNLVQSAKVEGMSIKEDFFSGALTVIRPLLLVSKPSIIKAAKTWGLPVWSSCCPSAGKTMRSQIEQSLNNFSDLNKKAKENIFSGLCRWQFNQTKIKNQQNTYK